MPTTRLSHYGEMIRDQLARSGHIAKYDPRHIEAFMRLEHPTLDGLSRAQFNAEVETSRRCVDEGGTAMAEQCAQSFGL